MNEEAHCRRSPDGVMEAQTIEGVQKDATQGRKSEKSWKGRSLQTLTGGILYPTKSIRRL